MSRKVSFLIIALFSSLLFFVSCNKDDDKSEPVPGAVRAKVNATKYDQWVYFSLRTGKIVAVSEPKSDKTWDIAFHRYDFRTNSGLSGNGSGGAYETNVKDISAAIDIPAAANFRKDENGVVLASFSHHGMGATVRNDSPMKYEVQPVNFPLTTDDAVWVEGKEGVEFKTVEVEMGPGKKVKMPERLKTPRCYGAIYQNLVMHGRSGQSSVPSYAIPEAVAPVDGALRQGPQVTLSEKVYIIRCADGTFARLKVLDYKEKQTTGIITFDYVYPAN